MFRPPVFGTENYRREFSARKNAPVLPSELGKGLGLCKRSDLRRISTGSKGKKPDGDILFQPAVTMQTETYPAPCNASASCLQEHIRTGRGLRSLPTLHITVFVSALSGHCPARRCCFPSVSPLFLSLFRLLRIFGHFVSTYTVAPRQNKFYLFCSRLLRIFGHFVSTYTVAPRQNKFYLFCSRLLRIFAV